jgi:hypothetical protein
MSLLLINLTLDFSLRLSLERARVPRWAFLSSCAIQFLKVRRVHDLDGIRTSFFSHLNCNCMPNIVTHSSVNLIYHLTLLIEHPASVDGRVKTEGSNTNLWKDSDSNYENSVTLTTEISFETSSEVAESADTDVQVNGILSDAFLVPSISIKVDVYSHRPF